MDPNTEEIKNLDQVLTKVRFDGIDKLEEELKEAASSPEDDTTGSDTETKTEETETKTDQETKPDEDAAGDETPTDTSKDEKPEDTTTAEPEEKKPEKTYLFKDMDEFEENYKNLQRIVSKKDDQIKEFEGAEERAAKIEQADTDYRTFVKDRKKETLKGIDELDSDSDDYDDKVSDLLADEMADIRKFEREHAEPVQTKAEDVGASSDTGGVDDVSQAMVRVKTLAAEVDIDPEDLYFKKFCNEAPARDESGKAIPFDDQVKFAINKTKEHYASKGGNTKTDAEKEAEAQALKNQEEDLSLGSTGGAHTTIKPGSESDKPKIITLNDAVESANTERII